MISKDSIVLKQLRNAQSINREAMLKSIMLDQKEELTEINKAQMRASETGEGMTPEYSPFTLSIKDFSNYKGVMPHYDLYDTGKFQNAMTMRIEGNSVRFDSTDSKKDEVIDTLSVSMSDPEIIFELNEKHLKQAQDMITPFYFKDYHQALNK